MSRLHIAVFYPAVRRLAGSVGKSDGPDMREIRDESVR
jgi:hypothetical protein